MIVGHLIQLRNRLISDTLVPETENRLSTSIHNAVLISLVKQKQDDRVQRSWSFDLSTKEDARQEIPPGTNIIDLFDSSSIRGRLLILGEPGAGKTTTLLELSQHLLERSKNDLQEPVPVILNLSTWKDDRQNIFSWAVSQISFVYGLREDIAKSWLKESHLMLLLDGLDEVEGERQPDCIRAINKFCEDHQPSYIVVCCRAANYENSNTLLDLNGSIYLKQLNDDQILQYLSAANCDGLWNSIKADNNLLEMVKSPLILSIMTLSASQISIQKWQRLLTLEDRRDYLFQAYISQMLARPSRNPDRYQIGSEPSREQTLKWLRYLANMLKKHSQTEFILEKIQPSWLSVHTNTASKDSGISLYRTIVSSLVGFIVGFSVSLNTKIAHAVQSGYQEWQQYDAITYMWTDSFLGLVTGVFPATVYAVLIASVYVAISVLGANKKLFQILLGVLGAALIGVLEGYTMIGHWFSSSINESIQSGVQYATIGVLVAIFSIRVRTVETIKLSVKGSLKGLLVGLILGLFISLLASFYILNYTPEWKSLVNAFREELLITVIFSVGGLALGSLSGPQLEQSHYTNEGIWRSFRTGLLFSLLTMCISVGILMMYRSFILKLELFQSLVFSIQWSIFPSLMSFLIPTFSAIQHFSLRVIMWKKGFAPWNYAKFLNSASDRLLLQRIGGRYRFIHNLLQESFAKR